MIFPPVVGNVAFRDMIRQMTEEYNDTGATRTQKSATIRAIINLVHSQGGRFLRQHQIHSQYVSSYCLLLNYLTGLIYSNIHAF
jgi:hypothetical protein